MFGINRGQLQQCIQNQFDCQSDNVTSEVNMLRGGRPVDPI